MGKGAKPKFCEPFQSKKKLDARRIKEQERDKKLKAQGLDPKKVKEERDLKKPKPDDTATGNIKNKLIKCHKLKAVRESKKQERKDRRKLVKANPELKQEPRTVESMRRTDETIVNEEDEEITADDKTDEFSKHFAGEVTPKILLTTCKNPHRKIFDFMKEFIHVIPNMFYYKRGDFTIAEISKQAIERGYTAIVVIQERMKELHGMYFCSLPEGPTSYFRITSLVKGQDMKGSAVCTDHLPELVMNNFDTRLGHRIERQMKSLFPFLSPEYQGRRIVTMHNQRDFIFFRHHRYVFKDEGERVALAEIGPSFTMKLRWIQQGTFDFDNGEYEFFWRPDLQVDRKKFYV